MLDDFPEVDPERIVFANVVGVNRSNLAGSHCKLYEALVVDDQLALDRPGLVVVERYQVSPAPVWFKPPH
jgi:hypothetical protein